MCQDRCRAENLFGDAVVEDVSRADRSSVTAESTDEDEEEEFDDSDAGDDAPEDEDDWETEMLSEDEDEAGNPLLCNTKFGRMPIQTAERVRLNGGGVRQTVKGRSARVKDGGSIFQMNDLTRYKDETCSCDLRLKKGATAKLKEFQKMSKSGQPKPVRYRTGVVLWFSVGNVAISSACKIHTPNATIWLMLQGTTYRCHF